jgi:TonB family protein
MLLKKKTLLNLLSASCMLYGFLAYPGLVLAQTYPETPRNPPPPPIETIEESPKEPDAETLRDIRENGEVLKVVEKMPRFPGGAAALMKFLNENMKFPKAAQDNHVNGIVIANFIVEKTGELTRVKITEGIGWGCDEEAMRLVNAMPKWEPGQHRGQAARVYFNLPIRFKLEDNPPLGEMPPPIESPTAPVHHEDPDHIYRVVDIMPSFPGGTRSMLQFLSENLKVAEAAKKDGTEGMVVIQFIVEKDGTLSNPNIVKGIGAGCDEEAQRVIGLMPKWIPGKKNGQLARVQFNLPLRFKLE